MRTDHRQPFAPIRPGPGAARPHAASERSRISLLDVAELADELGVKASYVRRLVHERRIPYLKIGRHVRFDPIEVREWLDAGKVGALW